jgi:uncharacterized DUF497 family protein
VISLVWFSIGCSPAGYLNRYAVCVQSRVENDIIENIKFEWDTKKARLNLCKHKVSFEEAATALKDPMAATGADPDHSISEDRCVTFGVSERDRLLVVAHTEDGETIRIISARVASKGERKIYEEG